MVRSGLGDISKLRTGVVLCLAAMSGSDVPAAALGVIDLRQIGLNSWLSDIGPHLACGLATAVAYDAVASTQT